MEQTDDELNSKQEYFNFKQAVSFLPFKESRLRTAVHKGEISYSKVGRLLVFKKSDLIMFINKNRVEVKNEF